MKITINFTKMNLMLEIRIYWDLNSIQKVQRWHIILRLKKCTTACIQFRKNVAKLLLNGIERKREYSDTHNRVSIPLRYLDWTSQRCCLFFFYTLAF
jgi:hypothetical protein